MNTGEPLDPAVQDILEATRDRPAPEGSVSVAPRSLQAALAEAAAAGHRPVIAEIKPTSPTAGGVADRDPVEMATAMVEGGATALSVLTEPTHFNGNPGMLQDVRDAVEVPVLRKDFVLNPAELDRVAADILLLIVRFVDDLPGMVAAAKDRGFQVLVEAHTAEEVEAALDAGADAVGVNNRDLAELTVDLSTFESVAREVTVPDTVPLIAESGISTQADADRMLDAGADGLLIGSAIMDHEGTDEDGAADPMAAITKRTKRFTGA